MASANGHADVVSALIAAGAVKALPTLACHRPASPTSLSSIHPSYFNMLGVAGAQEVCPRNAEGNTPLHWACLNGHQQVSNHCSSGGQFLCALLYVSLAWRWGHMSRYTTCRLQVAQLLMEAGADASVLNRCCVVHR